MGLGFEMVCILMECRFGVGGISGVAILGAQAPLWEATHKKLCQGQRALVTGLHESYKFCETTRNHKALQP